MKRICVFCGSRPGADARFAEAARQLGAQLAGRGLTLVYGGASVGLMGVVADATMRHGGEAIGVIPEALAGREIAHAGLSELHVVESMHARKAMMERLSDGFVALPGGMGTLEELCEILTWSQLGLHRKPVGLLNVAQYFSQFIGFLDVAQAQGFLSPADRDLLMVGQEPGALLTAMQGWEPPPRPAWIEEGET